MGSMTEGELLNRIYAAISRGEDLAEIICMAAEGAKSLFSGHAATVYFLDEEKLHLIPQNWGLPEGLTRKLEELVGFKVRRLQLPIVEGGHYWQTIHEQRAFLLTTPKEIQGLIGELTSDQTALKKLVPPISRLLGYRTVLTAPLVAAGDVVGVVDVGSRKPLEDEALEQFERLANSLSVAISSARLLEQIRTSERRYRAVVEGSADAIISLTTDLRVSSWSKGAEDIFGYAQEEILGQPCSILFPEEDRERTAQVFERVRTEGFVRGFQTQRLARDGHPVDVEITITSLGKDMGFTAVMRDITERKRSQELTLHLNLVLRALREVNQLITNEHDRERLLQRAMEILIETRGYHSAWIVLCDEKRDPCSMFSAGLGKESNLLKELLSREELPLCARRALSQPGVTTIVDQASECDGCPLIGKLPEHREMTARLEHEGKVYGLISVALAQGYVGEAEEEDLFSELAGDIASALYRLALEEKNAQFLETLQESEERFRSIVETSHAGILTIDEDYRILYVNEALTRIFGWASEDVIGHDFRDFLDDESRSLVAERYVQRQRGEEVPPRYEFNVIRKDGKKRRVEINSAVIHDSAGRKQTISQILDITDRVQAEEKLKESEEKHRSLIEDVLDSSSVGIFILDSNFKVVWINQALERYFGLKREDVIGKDKRELIRARIKDTFEDPEMFADKVIATYDNNTYIENFECHVMPSAGREERWLDHWSQPIRSGYYAGGRVEYYTDITARKRLEIGVRESEEQMRLIIETSPDAIFSVDRQGRFLSVNPIITKELGYSRDELLNMTLGEVILPEHIPQLKDRFKRVLLGETLHELGEYEVVGKDGRRLWIAVNSAPLRKDGVVVGFLGIARDITELKRQMIELAMSEKRFRSVAESATDAIITSNDEGRIIFWNTAAQSIFGYTADEVIGRSAALLMPKRFRKAFADGVRRWRETGDSSFTGKRVVYPGLRKDGSEFPAEIAYSVWSVGGASFTTAIIRDITARVLAKKALRESYVRAQRTLNGIVKALESAIELRDPYTAGHQVRVAELATAIAKEMDLSPDRIHGIRYAALVHDIGKIAVPAEILSKPTKLTRLEYSLIQAHPQQAYDILKGIEFPWPIADIVLQHHERMDGSGYPRGLKGDQILLEARILSVADVVEAMSSHRPYRAALGLDAALDEIRKNKGRLYDPDVVDACLVVFESGFTFE